MQRKIGPMKWLRVLYLFNGLAIGTLYGFIPVVLQARGFDPTLVGLGTGLGSLSYTLALPAWGHMGDIVHGPRRTLQLACLPAAIFALGFSAPVPAAVIILCEIALAASGGPAPALTDAMAVPVLADPSREYSRLRLLMSVGAGAGAIGSGLLYVQTGYLAAPLVFVLVAAGTILSAQLVPVGRDSERHRIARGAQDGIVVEAPKRGHFGSVGEVVAGYPRLLAVLVSVLFLFLAVMGSGTYLTLRISDLGGGPAEVGLANGLGSLAEVPGLLLAAWLAPRLGLRTILVVSSVGFAACVASWSVLEGALPILATRFLAGVFFGGITVAFVLTVAALLPERLQSTGQTLFQAIGFGLAAVLSNLAGGVIYQSVGPAGVFGSLGLCALAGGMLGLLALAPPEERLEVVAAEPVSVAD